MFLPRLQGDELLLLVGEFNLVIFDGDLPALLTDRFEFVYLFMVPFAGPVDLALDFLDFLLEFVQIFSPSYAFPFEQTHRSP